MLDDVGEIIFALGLLQLQTVEQRAQSCRIHRHDAGIAKPFALQVLVGMPFLDQFRESAFIKAQPAIAARVLRAKTKHRDSGIFFTPLRQKLHQGPCRQQRRIPVEHENIAMCRQALARSHQGVASAEGRILDRYRGRHGRLRHRRLDVAHAVGEHDHRIFRLEPRGGRQHMADHAPARQRVQHLRKAGLHAGSLAGGEHDGGEAMGHGSASPVGDKAQAGDDFRSMSGLCNRAGSNGKPEKGMMERSFERIRERFDAVIFDLDGTLVDTAPDILAYLNDMLDELGRPGLDLAAVRSMIGDGVKSLMIRGLEASGGIPDAVDLDDLFHRYLERYSAEPVRSSQPYPGMVDALEALSNAGVKLGVCTNKPQTPTDRLLARLGLDRYFGAAIGGDALAIKKPDPDHLLAVLDRLQVEPQHAVLIGDSDTDLKTAHAAGIPCILVSFGYTAIPASELGADRVIDHANDLIPTLRTLSQKPPSLDSSEARPL